MQAGITMEVYMMTLVVLASKQTTEVDDGRTSGRKSALKFARALIISKYFHDRRRAF